MIFTLFWISNIQWTTFNNRTWFLSPMMTWPGRNWETFCCIKGTVKHNISCHLVHFWFCIKERPLPFLQCTTLGLHKLVYSKQYKEMCIIMDNIQTAKRKEKISAATGDWPKLCRQTFQTNYLLIYFFFLYTSVLYWSFYCSSYKKGMC